MSNKTLKKTIEKVDLLTTEEQRRLIMALAERARTSTVDRTEPPRKWSDLIGMSSYPACGEDAQSYISRSRRETDDKRLADTNR